MSKFVELGLREAILRAVQEGGYEDMTPIQSQAIPEILKGSDLIAVAQTGTGKTAAFSLPVIQMLLKGEGKRKARTARSLILAPTRELAIQIADNIKAYAKYVHLRTTIVYGGISSKVQIKAMEAGVDILIATPGRLLDLVNQGFINLSQVEFLILDEADRMLDMGFIRDIRKIIEHLPKKRQTLFFSATMPIVVETLANTILRNPVRIEVAPASTTAEKVDQYVLMVPKSRKRDLLVHMLKDTHTKRVLVFTRTKHGANRVATHLEKRGISTGAIHGNKSQNARQKTLNAFRDGTIRALVATDVAARGIDVDGVTHVINFDLPNEPESYVHRIGRTARAGAAGISLSFCDHEERTYLRDIEKIIRQKIPLMVEHPYHFEGIEAQDPNPDKNEPDHRDAYRQRRGSGKSRAGRPNSGHRNNGPKAYGDNPRNAKAGGYNTGAAQRKIRPASSRAR